MVCHKWVRKNYRLTLVRTFEELYNNCNWHSEKEQDRNFPLRLLSQKAELNTETSLVFWRKLHWLHVPKEGKNVLSTMNHDAVIDESTKEKRKLEIITFYNSTKGGVDIVDQLYSTYNVSRNSRRCPATVFYTILHVAWINAYNIFMANYQRTIRRRSF